MGKYELAFKKSVAKDLRAFPAKNVHRILKCFEMLALNPRPPDAKSSPVRSDIGCARGSIALSMKSRMIG